MATVAGVGLDNTTDWVLGVAQRGTFKDYYTIGPYQMGLMAARAPCASSPILKM